MIACLNIFIGAFTTISTSFIDRLALNNPDILKINNILKPTFLVLFPHYCLGRGILDLSVQYQIAQMNMNSGIKSTYSGFDFNIIGKNILALFVQGIVFFIMNMLIEYKFFIRSSVKKGNLLSNDELNDEDEDVRAERNRIMRLEEIKIKTDEKRSKFKTRKDDINKSNYDDTKDYLKLVNMSKVYTKLKGFKKKRHVAVKSLYLGIDKGECFGLIGFF